MEVRRLGNPGGKFALNDFILSFGHKDAAKVAPQTQQQKKAHVAHSKSLWQGYAMLWSGTGKKRKRP